MTDKVQKIRQEVVRMHNLLPIMDGYNISVNYADRICTTLEMYIDSLQEEPISNNLEKTSRNYEDKEKFRKEVEKLKSNLIYGACSSQIAMETRCKEEAYNEVLAILDTMQEEPVSEDLGEYINELSKQFPEVSFAKLSRIAVRVAKWQKEKEYTCYEEAFDDGAKWQKNNLWKPADGDDLPDIDREVIVLIKYNTQRNIHDEEYPTYRVGFGHRPNPDGWDGKNIDTNKVTHYTPKLCDKGGWNAPDIAYWLDVKLPYEEK